MDYSNLHPAAIAFPVLAFGSWILCIPPLTWHFSQRNIAASSLILWIFMVNWFDSINSLIWPRDNIGEWWNGKIWCDINVRIQIGGTVGMSSSVVMIVRRLARIMDTQNMTMSCNKKDKRKEMALEIFMCWGYPMVLILLYYIVQPMRYMIYGIVGCWSAYDTSWPSVVLSYMWGPLTMCVAAYYAGMSFCDYPIALTTHNHPGLLLYRLYRYRREFHRLVAARNTTKSRFVRLFLICVVIILLCLPYNLYLLLKLLPEIKDPYDWNTVHGPNFDSILMIPVFGQVPADKWGQVASGYVIFLIFGTGTDAYNTYRTMLLALGFGKVFPILFKVRENGTSKPSIALRTWSSGMGNKARSLFLNTLSVTETVDESTRSNSFAIQNIDSVCTESGILPQTAKRTSSTSFFKRVFCRQGSHGTILPLSSNHSAEKTLDADAELEMEMEKSRPESMSPGVYAHAWASNSRRSSEPAGVHVVLEVHLARHERSESGQVKNSVDSWA